MSEAGYWEEEEFAARFSSKTILRILGLVRARWRWVLGFVVTVAIVSMLEAIFTYLGKIIIDEGIVPGDTESLTRVLLLYGAGQIVFAACVFGFIVLAGVLGQHVQYDLRRRLFNHLQTLSLSYFSKTPVGWIMSRVNSDSERIADLVTWGMLDVVWALMNIVTAFVFMISINWQMTLIVFAVLPILLMIAVWFQKRILVEYRLVRKQNSKITGAYNENITGVRVVKALGREAQNLEEFSALSVGMYRASFRAAWLSALFLPSVQLVSAVALGIIVWYGGSQALGGTLTVGSIQAFIGYITFMLWPVQDLARVYAEMQHAVASAERTFSLLDTEPEIKDRPNAVAAETLMGEIRFEDVTFYYTDDKPVLRNFNLTVQGGETVALVGPTGGGKSTIINLICRFYEPKKGVIRINGRDYTEYTLDSIQSRVGVVLQTPHLFSGSIRENIRYGRLAASDAEVEEAAKVAGAHPFISNLEKGYAEEVGEGGNLLSVGQKQLISLARAVLAKPEIFIMDEATSSVDTLTEALIQRGMEALMHGRTSFVIAHRLSTIRRADKIIVIEDGSIAEMGNHAELMRQRGHYYRLYTQQFRAEREQAYDPFGDQQVPAAAIEAAQPAATEAVA